MSYINSINNDSTDYAINSFANLLTASGSASGAKTVTFPNGYDVTDGSTMTFRVLFPNGHTGQSNMTLNGKAVVVNKHGTLIPLPYHNISSTYTSLQPNTVLEMYYTSNYDGNNTPAFVIVGNPIVLSSNNYIIYADGKNLTDTIYPVGSLYWSSKSTNPASLFGGTWVQIKDRFILARGDTYKTVGATGGASSVTLSVSNMPSHSHSFTPSGTISMDAHSHSFTPSGTVSSSFKGENQTGSVRMDNGVNGGSPLGTASGVFFTSGESPINLDSGSWNKRASTLNFSMTPSGTVSSSFTGTSKNTTPTTSTGSFTGSAGTTSSNGSGTSFSILPPYVVKYCWERTA